MRSLEDSLPENPEAGVDLNSNPPLIQGPFTGAAGGHRDHWSYRPSIPQSHNPPSSPPMEATIRPISTEPLGGERRRKRSIMQHEGPSNDSEPSSQQGNARDQTLFRPGTSAFSINNPRLLETVEDVIRRLILPEMSQLKREQQIQVKHAKHDDVTKNRHRSRDVAAGVRQHDPTDGDRVRRKKRSKSQSRIANLAESDEIFEKHDIPPLPMLNDIGPETTRGSILLEQNAGPSAPGRGSKVIEAPDHQMYDQGEEMAASAQTVDSRADNRRHKSSSSAFFPKISRWSRTNSPFPKSHEKIKEGIDTASDDMVREEARSPSVAQDGYGLAESSKEDLLVQFDGQMNEEGEAQAIQLHQIYKSKTEIPYTHIDYLGNGTFGYVDKVECTTSSKGKHYARKIIRSSNWDATQELEAIQNKVAIIKRLSHRHIARLVCTYQFEKHFCIIMLPVADGHLGDFLSELDKTEIRAEREQGLEHIWRWYGCLAQAIEYLHRENVRHK